MITGIVVFVVMELASLMLPTLLGVGLAAPDPDGIYFFAYYYAISTNIGKMMIVKTLLEVLVVVSATVVSVYNLKRRDMIQGGTEGAARNSNKAAWTVVILSTIFIVFNVSFLAITTRFLLNPFAHLGNSYALFAYFAIFMVMPLNSTINPMVYLVRIHDMRQFFAQRFRRSRLEPAHGNL